MRSNNQKGMTLIEVMIAISILSVISVAVISLMKNLDKTSKTAQKKADIDSTMREIQAHLADKQNCSATVYGASGSLNTVITGLKEIDLRPGQNGDVRAHNRLKSSTLSSPSFIAPGVIINGMFLKWVSDTTTGANYELYVTFIKSVKAANSPTTAAADSMYGPNVVTKKIALQLDNCDRYVAFGNTQQAAAGHCSASGGYTVGDYVGLYSAAGAAANAAGVSDTQFGVACRICPTIRAPVKGCL